MSTRADRPPAPPLPPGPTARTLRPIDGRDLDPPDVDPPLVRRAVAASDAAAWLWRWWERFRDGRGTLSAKGIAFYSFFGVLSGLVLAFSVAAQIPAYDDLLSEILSEALPGLVGPDALNPEQLRSAGATIGTVGGFVLLYSAVGIIRAVDDGVRLVFGVQYEPRRFVVKTARHLGYLALLTPLMALSYTAASATAGLFRPLLSAFGIGGTWAAVITATLGVAAAVGVNSVSITLILSRLGGVRPQRWRWRASLLGGAAMAVVQWGTTLFVALTVSNPRYVSFGAPVAMLLLFFVMSVVVLATAAFVATANEPNPVLAARRQQRSATGSPRE